MGGMKEQLLSEREDECISLSAMLEISWTELESLQYELSPNYTKDGMLVGYHLAFDSNSDPDILQKIPDLFDDFSVELPPWALDLTPEDDYELSAITHDFVFRESFQAEATKLEKLLRIELGDPELMQVLLRQIFIGIITSIESYLSETFINKTLSSEYFLKRFVQNHPEFKKQKFSLNDVFREHERIEEKAKAIMISTIYHKMPVVKNLYESTFGVDFPNISRMQEYVIQRHDLVHRNGKTKEGVILELTPGSVSIVLENSVRFVESVASALEQDDPF